MNISPSQEKRKISRRLPRWSEVAPLIVPEKRAGNLTDRRLSYAMNVADLRLMAKRRVPRSVFDYVDGAAESEVSLSRARAAYRSVEFQPEVLIDVSNTDTSTTILGKPAAMPLIFAPTGFTRMMHHEGEIAVARVAARTGIPYALSTMGTTSVQDLAAAVPDVNRWFQLYVWKDRAFAQRLAQDAWDNGYGTLVLTVDTPVAGARLRDGRNGMTIPPTLNPKTFLDMGLHPNWWANLLTTDPIEFASLKSSGGSLADMINRLFDPSIQMQDIEWLRDIFPGQIVVKGIQTVADAIRVADFGADAITLSNHGGRQLDRAPTSLDILGETVAAVGDRMEIFIDSGVMNGGDVIAAVANGAKGVLVGRAYLYGLMAGGEKGVQRMADLFQGEMTRTMQLLGVSRIEDLEPRHAVLARRNTKDSEQDS